MAKKKKDSRIEDLEPGDKFTCPDGLTRTVQVIDPIIDPRGGIYLDSDPQEFYVRFSDGHREVLERSEKTILEVVQPEERK